MNGAPDRPSLVNAQDQLRTFAACVFEPDDIVEVRRLPSARSSWHRAGELHTQRNTLLMENQLGENVYIGANPRRAKGTQGVRAEDCKPDSPCGKCDRCVGMARTVFVDFDGGVTPGEAQKRVEEAELPRPTMVNFTGHGVHVYWRPRTPITDMPKWTAAQQGLIALLKTDRSIHNPSRIMRLPGFTNHKPPVTPCYIVEADPKRLYELADLAERIPRIKHEEPRPSTPRVTESDGDCLSVLARVARYAGKWPAVSEGERNKEAMRHAADLTHDWKLPDDEALSILSTWNARSLPPLDDAELRQCLTNGKRYGRHRRGEKADRPPPDGGNAAVTKSRMPVLDAPAKWPDPMAEAAFHGPAGEIVRLIEAHTEADPAALLLDLLVSIGSMVGRFSYFLADGARHHPNLFAVLVGETSKGRKGTARANNMRVLESVDAGWSKNHILSGLSSGEGIIWAVRDAIWKRTPVKKKGRLTGEYDEFQDDPGVRDKRLMVLESEFSRVLRVSGRDGNSLSATIRQAWDTGNLQTLTKNSPAKAAGAHISILGHITRDELRRYLDSTEACNGFGNRFLWVCVKRSKCLPDGGNLSRVDFSSVRQKLVAAVEFGRTEREIQRDDQARDIWHAVYPQLSEGGYGLLGAVTSRAEAQVMRLAMIYALLDCSREIRAEHLRAALAVWEYCESSARYIFGDVLGDPVADAILRALRDRGCGGMTRTDVSDFLGRNASVGRISRALNLLRSCGRAFAVREDTSGRPAERWFAGNGER